MSTFLELVQNLGIESGTTDDATTTITTTVDQDGEPARLVNWVRQAHTELQNRNDNWRWMRSKFTFQATQGTDTYAGTVATDTRLNLPVTRLARWIVIDDGGASNIKKYLTSGGVAGEIWMTVLPWSYFQAIYKRGPQNPGPPIHVTIDPQNNLVLGPSPDNTYTINGEYQMSALIFANDGDTPEFPVRFHDVVLWKALLKYGVYEAAEEVIARAKSDGARLMRQLEIDQLPALTLGAPLA